MVHCTYPPVLLLSNCPVLTWMLRDEIEGPAKSMLSVLAVLRAQQDLSHSHMSWQDTRLLTFHELQSRQHRLRHVQVFRGKYYQSQPSAHHAHTCICRPTRPSVATTTMATARIHHTPQTHTTNRPRMTRMAHRISITRQTRTISQIHSIHPLHSRRRLCTTRILLTASIPRTRSQHRHPQTTSVRSTTPSTHLLVRNPSSHRHIAAQMKTMGMATFRFSSGKIPPSDPCRCQVATQK